MIAMVHPERVVRRVQSPIGFFVPIYGPYMLHRGPVGDGIRLYEWLLFI